MTPADWQWMRERAQEVERFGRLVVELCNERLTKHETLERAIEEKIARGEARYWDTFDKDGKVKP